MCSAVRRARGWVAPLPPLPPPPPKCLRSAAQIMELQRNFGVAPSNKDHSGCDGLLLLGGQVQPVLSGPCAEDLLTAATFAAAAPPGAAAPERGADRRPSATATALGTSFRTDRQMTASAWRTEGEGSAAADPSWVADTDADDGAGAGLALEKEGTRFYPIPITPASNLGALLDRHVSADAQVPTPSYVRVLPPIASVMPDLKDCAKQWVYVQVWARAFVGGDTGRSRGRAGGGARVGARAGARIRVLGGGGGLWYATNLREVTGSDGLQWVEVGSEWAHFTRFAPQKWCGIRFGDTWRSGRSGAQNSFFR